MSFKFDLQLFGGGGSSTTVNESKYTPSEYELQLQKAQADYANAIAPNSLWLNDTARKVLQDSLGTVQVDYNKMNQNAQNQISGAQQGYSSLIPQYSNLANANNAANATYASQISGLQNGILPQSYLDNMSDAIRSGVTNTVGQNINDLGNRGVLNSSVTGQAMNDIEKNVSNTMAQQYNNNISQLSNLYGNQFNNAMQTNSSNAGLLGQQGSTYGNLLNSATSGTTAAAAAQEAAQQPALNLWNASIGLNGTTTGALAAAAGKGTTTNTATTSVGSSGLLGGLLGGIL